MEFYCSLLLDMVADAERSLGAVDSQFSGTGGGNIGTPAICYRISNPLLTGTSAGGQFGWGGTPLKSIKGAQRLAQAGQKLRRRVQRQKPV